MGGGRGAETRGMRSQSRDVMVPKEGAAPAPGSLSWRPDLGGGGREEESGARSGKLTGHPRE